MKALSVAEDCRGESRRPVESRTRVVVTVVTPEAVAASGVFLPASNSATVEGSGHCWHESELCPKYIDLIPSVLLSCAPAIGLASSWSSNASVLHWLATTRPIWVSISKKSCIQYIAARANATDSNMRLEGDEYNPGVDNIPYCTHYYLSISTEDTPRGPNRQVHIISQPTSSRASREFQHP